MAERQKPVAIFGQACNPTPYTALPLVCRRLNKQSGFTFVAKNSPILCLFRAYICLFKSLFGKSPILQDETSGTGAGTSSQQFAESELTVCAR
jgi:hypothetical protein